MSDNDQIVLEHYRQVADECGHSPSSTMADEVVRAKEVRLIQGFFELLDGAGETPARVLDLGCGNGHTVASLAGRNSTTAWWGVDFSPEMVELARARGIERCTFERGDARDLPFEDGFFDVVYTERCLINLLDWPAQEKALGEIARVLRPGGRYLMIECFTDGMENNNRARREVGLDDVPPAFHNLYFEKQAFEDAVRPLFDVREPRSLSPQAGDDLASNFLSSHYFVARVLHPLVTKGEWRRNTEFVKFFSFLPPSGQYSPIQAFLLERRG